ncbi:MAG: MFS transporter, partial [Alphaproteobacteria bacterium]|nr:MFS transporter [Alphaproteobacteria bacterium]
MIATIERLSGLEWKSQGTVFLVGFGHAGTHWIIGSIYVLLPYIQRDLQFSYTAVGTLFTVFHFSAFAANFASGLLVDVTGRRVALMVASLTLGGAAFMASGWALGMPVLMALMILIGATNNLWHPPAISFLSRLYPNSRGYALSIHAFGASFGDIVAPLAMGVLLVGLTWQSTVKLSALPVFLIAAVIGVFLIARDSHTPDQNGEAKRGMSLKEYFTGISTLLRDRSVVGLALMAGVRSMAQSGLLLFIPLYLANVLQVGPTLVGVGIAAMQLGGMIAGPIAGTWSDRAGRRPVVLAGLSGSTLVIAALTLAGNEVLFIAGISLLGFLLFAVRPVVHSWMMDLTPPDMAGSATSVLFGAQSLLSGAAPLIGGLIADTWGLGAVFYALAGTMLVANVMVF